MVPRGHYLRPDQKMNRCCTMCEATHWSSFFYMMYRAAARRALIVLFMPAFCFCRGSSLICAHMRVNLFLFWHEENMMYSWSRYFLDNTLSLSHTHTLTHTHSYRGRKSRANGFSKDGIQPNFRHAYSPW